jgi:hypothetical protein
MNKMKKKTKATKSNSTFSLSSGLIVRLAEAKIATGFSISRMVELAITDYFKTIIFDCPICGAGLISGRCPQPSKH